MCGPRFVPNLAAETNFAQPPAAFGNVIDVCLLQTRGFVHFGSGQGEPMAGRRAEITAHHEADVQPDPERQRHILYLDGRYIFRGLPLPRLAARLQ